MTKRLHPEQHPIPSPCHHFWDIYFANTNPAQLEITIRRVTSQNSSVNYSQRTNAPNISRRVFEPAEPSWTYLGNCCHGCSRWRSVAVDKRVKGKKNHLVEVLQRPQRHGLQQSETRPMAYLCNALQGNAVSGSAHVLSMPHGAKVPSKESRSR